jgi:KUP system potassium uptake protein
MGCDCHHGDCRSWYVHYFRTISLSCTSTVLNNDHPARGTVRFSLRDRGRSTLCRHGAFRFSRDPICLAGIVLPSLLLNYAGQSAVVLEGTPTVGNIFYRLCPEPLLIPFVVLATIATIIASQSIITGTFSMTRQAIQLGWMPRLRIVQTSEKGYGQIYVGVINWLLMIVTVGLTLFFGKSDNLAGAYGIAVSATMMLTSGLLFIAMREVWCWRLLMSLAVAGVFLCIDACFFLANLVKVAQGGYVPLLLAALVYGIMLIWHRGSVKVAQRVGEQITSVDEFMRWIKSHDIPRVPGTGVFLTRTSHDAPPVMIWHVKHNRALQENLFVLNAVTEKPDIPAVLKQACLQNQSLKLGDVVYYVGHGTIVPRDDLRGLAKWQDALYIAMERNSVHASDFFRLPNDSVVLIARQILI